MSSVVFTEKLIAFVDVLGFKKLVEAAEGGNEAPLAAALSTLEKYGGAKHRKDFIVYGHNVCPDIHFSAAEAISEYIGVAGIESGPLFRPRVSQHGEALAARRITERTMYRILMSYLRRLPGAMEVREMPSGKTCSECLYSPHSLRATTATLLLDSSVPIESVQDLLDHKHITRTQIYDKRRRSVRDSASHKVPI